MKSCWSEPACRPFVSAMKCVTQDVRARLYMWTGWSPPQGPGEGAGRAGSPQHPTPCTHVPSYFWGPGSPHMVSPSLGPCDGPPQCCECPLHLRLPLHPSPRRGSSLLPPQELMSPENDSLQSGTSLCSLPATMKSLPTPNPPPTPTRFCLPAGQHRPPVTQPRLQILSLPLILCDLEQYLGLSKF